MFIAHRQFKKKTLGHWYTLREKSLPILSGTYELFDASRGVKKRCKTWHWAFTALFYRCHVWLCFWGDGWRQKACRSHSKWVKIFPGECTCNPTCPNFGNQRGFTMKVRSWNYAINCGYEIVLPFWRQTGLQKTLPDVAFGLPYTDLSDVMSGIVDWRHVYRWNTGQILSL